MPRYDSLFERIVSNTRIEGECWIWTGKSSRYPKMNVWQDGKHRTVNVHRVVLELTTGWLFPFDEAGHYHCFNPLCVNPEHLRIETPAENKSGRRGYKACEGRLIPVLFPTDDRLLQEAADAAWDGVGSVVCFECPI